MRGSKKELTYIELCYKQISGPESIEDAEAQWDWLEATLRSSTAHYLIVGGHYPVWSIAEHGPTKCLVDRLRPLLQKYNVTAYINGHDHNLQVSEFFNRKNESLNNAFFRFFDCILTSAFSLLGFDLILINKITLVNAYSRSS